MELIDKNIFPFEDYSNELRLISEGVYEYVNCSNNNLLSESTFKRLVNILENETYAILSAYRKKFSKKDNIIRNRNLRDILDSYKMGVYQLVGHWREAPDGKEYNETPENELQDTIERSYVVKKPKNMSYEDFKKILTRCLTIDGETQDCGIIHKENDKWYLYFANGDEDFLGEKITFNKVGQAYSQLVKKINQPFVFEYLECPSSNSGSLLMTKHNIKYLND